MSTVPWYPMMPDVFAELSFTKKIKSFVLSGGGVTLDNWQVMLVDVFAVHTPSLYTLLVSLSW